MFFLTNLTLHVYPHLFYRYVPPGEKLFKRVLIEEQLIISNTNMPPLSLNNIFPDPNSWQTTEGEKHMLRYSWTVIQSCRTKAKLACLHSQRKNMALSWQLQADNCNSDTNHFKSLLSFFFPPLRDRERAEGWKQMGTVKEGSVLCTVVDRCMYVCILGTVFSPPFFLLLSPSLKSGC